MKRFLLAFLCLILLFVLPIYAANTNFVQVVELKENGGILSITATHSPAFWELPTLRKGETVSVDGVLTLTNRATETRMLRLDSVEFPYDDPDALCYLNHLQITIKKGDVLYYNGPYSHINNDDGLLLTETLDAGAEVSYTINLRCDYTYTGSNSAIENTLHWNFRTVLEEDSFPSDNSSGILSNPLIIQLLISMVVAVTLLFVLAYLRDRRDKTQ